MKAGDGVWVMAKVTVDPAVTPHGKVNVMGLRANGGASLIDERFIYPTKRDLFGAVVEVCKRNLRYDKPNGGRYFVFDDGEAPVRFYWSPINTMGPSLCWFDDEPPKAELEAKVEDLQRQLDELRKEMAK